MLVAMRQAHRWLIIAALGVTGIAGVTACGQPGTATRSPADTATESTVEVIEALGMEAGALAAMGFNLADLALTGPGQAPAAGAAGAGPSPAASASAGPQRRGEAWRKRHAYRVLLRRNTLHGEAVVKTRDGTTRTVVVQRGTVTELNDTTITVKSTDGYTLTWTFGDPMHVIEHRDTIKANEIQVGAEVGVAGAKDGSATLARLIVIPRKK